jgi:hypothetical protein
MINAKEATQLSIESKSLEETRISEMVQKYIPTVEKFIKNACNGGMFETSVNYKNLECINISDKDAYKIMDGLKLYLIDFGYTTHLITDRTASVKSSAINISWNNHE